MAVVQFGYVAVDGTHDAVTVSPSAGMTGTALRDLVIAAWRGAGQPVPVWVDGSPAALIAAISTRLALPSGMPVGWFPAAVDPVVVG